MKVTFTDGTVYAIDSFDDLTNREAMLLEDHLGCGLKDIKARVEDGSVVAITAFVWVLARRTSPDLDFDDVEFSLASLEDSEPDPNDDAGSPGEPS